MTPEGKFLVPSAWESAASAWRAALTAGLTVVADAGVVVVVGITAGSVGRVGALGVLASPTTRATERTAAGTGTPTA
jgi:hypothetical protein